MTDEKLDRIVHEWLSAGLTKKVAPMDLARTVRDSVIDECAQLCEAMAEQEAKEADELDEITCHGTCNLIRAANRMRELKGSGR